MEERKVEGGELLSTVGWEKYSQGKNECRLRYLLKRWHIVVLCEIGREAGGRCDEKINQTTTKVELGLNRRVKRGGSVPQTKQKKGAFYSWRSKIKEPFLLAHKLTEEKKKVENEWFAQSNTAILLRDLCSTPLCRLPWALPACLGSQQLSLAHFLQRSRKDYCSWSW